MDVFKLQELSEDPDPHATLPFISHHTLNLSRDLEDDKEKKREDLRGGKEALSQMQGRIRMHEKHIHNALAWRHQNS